MGQKDTLNFFVQKDNIFSKLVVVLVISMTASCCTLPLFIHLGLPHAHDIVFHTFQATQFNQSIHDGVFYPRWTPDSNNGYGSPTFVFYSPLSYYFVSAINFFLPSLIISMIIAVWFSFFLSGITMFIASDKIFGRSGSILSAVIYQILPFHILDLYVRGTFAELFAFIWFPLIILFIHESLEEKGKTASIGLCISYLGLILTHLVSGFIFTFIIGAYLMYKYFLLKEKRPLLKTLLSLAIGIGLSSFYLIPVIFEQQFIHIEYLLNCPVCDYKKNFLFIQHKFQDFYLSLSMVVTLEVMLSIVIVFLIRQNRNILFHKSEQKFFFVIFFVAFFLTTPLSRPLWDFTPLLPTIQFPWRWVPVMEFSLCMLISSIFSDKEKTSIRLTGFKKRAFFYIIIVISIVSLTMMLKGRIFSEEILKEILRPEHINQYMDPPIEYIPIWVSNVEEIVSEKKYDKMSVISGLGEYDVIDWRSEMRVITIKAFTPVLLQISTFYYPGWKADLDGKELLIKIGKQNGLILIDIPGGEHTLTLKFVDTPLRYYSKLISLFSFFVMVYLVMTKKK